VAAIEDPDPNVRGKGFAQLRAAGVQVEVGVGAAAAEAQNAAFLLHRRQGRPRVTLKAAASLDGKVAAPDGTSQWITGEAARADAHRLRAEADAVAVGAGTALADDPRLTVRLPGWSGRQPLRVLLDATGRTVTGPTGRGGPAGATGSTVAAGRTGPTGRTVTDPRTGPAAHALGQLFDGAAPTLVATTAAAPRAALQAWTAAGAEVLVCPDAPAASGEAGVDLAFIAKSLGERGVLELLVEGGPRLHASFWEAGLADRLVWYLAPLVIGGDGAHGLLPAAGAHTLTAARAVRIETVDRLGPDLRIVGYPQEGT
jgi:diaminohydroxyphosphoribosylaminopyrimidine deaminase/5-amino-6-(5-phosphoribosylamino)uracil reductase